MSRAQQDLLLAEKASAKLQAERDDLGKKVGPGFGDHMLRVWPLASGLLSLPRACCTLSLILPVGGVKACMKVPCFNASRQAHTAHGALVVCRYSQVVAHAAVEGWAGLDITGLQLSASPPCIVA